MDIPIDYMQRVELVNKIGYEPRICKVNHIGSPILKLKNYAYCAECVAESIEKVLEMFEVEGFYIAGIP